MSLVAMPMILQPVLGFCFLILVANSTSVQEYGALSFAIVLVSTVVSFSDLGLRDYLLSSKGMRSGSSSLESLVGPVFFITIFLVSLCVVYLYVGGGGKQLFLASLPEILALGVFHKCLFFVHQKDSILEGFSKLDSLNKAAIFLVKMVVLVMTEDLFLAVLSGSFVGFVLYGGWLFCVVSRMKGPLISFFFNVGKITLIIRSWREWLPFSISFFSFFLYFHSDRFVVEAFLGEKELAIYAAAYSFIAVGQIAVGVVWSLYMPKVSQGIEPFSKLEMKKASFAISLVLLVFYQVFAWYGFEYLYPDGFEESPLLLSILSLFFIFRMPNVVSEMYWVANDLVGKFVRIRLIAGVSNVVLNILFVPAFGLHVAAVTTVLSEAMVMLFVYFQEKKK